MAWEIISMIYLFVFCSLCTAQTPAPTGTAQSIIWNVPDGKKSDLSQTFTEGTTLPLSWNSWPSSSFIDPTQHLLDLYVASFDWYLNDFFQLLTQNVNLTRSGNFAWTIAIPDSNLTDPKYVLRFKIAGQAFDPNTPDLSSPGFLVLRANDPSVSISSSPTIPPSMISSITPTSIVPTSISPASSTSSATKPAVQECTSCGVSGGSKAGIGIGVVIGVLAVVSGAWLFLKRRRAAEEIITSRPQPNAITTSSEEMYRPPNYPVEAPTKPVWAKDSRVELPE